MSAYQSPRISSANAVRQNMETMLRANSFIIDDDLKKIHDTWKVVDEQINDPNSAYIPKAKTSNNPNDKRRFRPIRVFVSSTFTDFFSEREILVKQFFPELREWCLKRNLDLIECDLRWGVPADTTSDNTILTCLKELDRCYKDNGQPFFIGLLGEKYGWVPDITKLSPDLVERYKWIPDISITFMEYLHGALRSRNSNACFFFRSKDSLNGVPVEYNEKFFETLPFSKLQLQVEKEKLRNYFLDQIVDYSCLFDGFDETTGRKRPKLSGLEEFGSKVVEFLKIAIERTYPDAKEIVQAASGTSENEKDGAEEKNNAELEEENSHQIFNVAQKTNFFIGFQTELATVLDFAKNGHISVDHFKLNELVEDNLTETTVQDQTMRPLVIVGEEGSGKNTFASYLVKTLQEQSDLNPFYHFFYASSQSERVELLYARFLEHYSSVLGLANSAQIGFYGDQNKQAVNSMLEKLSDTKKVLVLGDFELRGSNQNEWLDIFTSDKLGQNAAVVLTLKKSDLAAFGKEYMQGRSFYTLNLDNFDKETSKLYVEKYLEKYNKKLADNQMNLIMAKAESNNNRLSPLWLSFVCNEMRIFGEFSTITKKIENSPIDLNELIVQILNRVNVDFKENVVIDILCIICVSENGIPENEISQLLEAYGHQLNRLEWSQISVSLKQFVTQSSYGVAQVVRFNNRRLTQIVSKNFIQNPPQTRSEESEVPLKDTKFYLEKLVDFCRNKSKYRQLAAMQCVNGYRNMSNKKAAADYIFSDEAREQLNLGMRIFIMNWARCYMAVFKNMPGSPDNIKYCFMCASKMSPKSNGRISYKDSCFVCGQFNFANSGMPGLKDRQVFRCQRHSFNAHLKSVMWDCEVCKMSYQNTGTGFTQKPIDAYYCMMCRADICCNFDA